MTGRSRPEYQFSAPHSHRLERAVKSPRRQAQRCSRHQTSACSTELNQGGQNKEASASSDDIYTDGVKITGLYSAGRSFSIEISGTFVGTVTFAAFERQRERLYRLAELHRLTTASVYDGNDNETWYYRLAVKPGNYTSGTINMRITFQGGSTAGIVRVTKYTSTTSVTAEVPE